jgi:hypothetical protein
LERQDYAGSRKNASNHPLVRRAKRFAHLSFACPEAMQCGKPD